MPTVAWPSPAHHDRTVKVWDLTSGQELRTLAGHTDGVSSVAVSADGRLALSGSDDRTVKVWDLTSGQELRTLAGHAGWVKSVAVSADGRLALSGSSDSTVKVWDLTSGQELRTLAGHAYGVKVGGGECRRSPGPLRLIATARSRSGTWKRGNAWQLFRLRARSMEPRLLAKDGATVVVGDATGGVTCLRLVLP